MLNGKKRAYLRSLANNIKPTTQIGKDGVSGEFLDQLDDQLRAREIVKINILENAGLDAKEVANAVCERLRAEYVQAIGGKFTIYRKNNENPKIVFPGHEQAKAKKKEERSRQKSTKKGSFSKNDNGFSKGRRTSKKSIRNTSAKKK